MTAPIQPAQPELIKILEKHGAKASFFVVGREAERHPEVMRQLAAAGHDIGSHSYAHLFAWTTDPVRTFLDLQRGNRIACEFNPAGAVEFFRPPYGKLNLASLLFMATGGRTIWWNVDPRDYETNSSGAIASHVIERMKPGSVILLHDGGNRALKSKQATVDAVDAILTAASGRGLRIATVREVFG